MSKEALSVEDTLKLALEALENNMQTHYYCEDTWYSCPKHEEGCANESEGDECNCGADKANAEIDKAITAIKEALRSSPNGEAQPEQHQDWCASLTQLLMSMPPKQAPCNCKPPQRTAAVGEDTRRAWVGLTEQEQGAIMEDLNTHGTNLYPFAQAIEGKLKQKNSA